MINQRNILIKNPQKRTCYTQFYHKKFNYIGDNPIKLKLKRLNQLFEYMYARKAVELRNRR
ncbi:MAG: hypothetical protein COA73_02300 [Candidatus Hydrogenedentota bacterium]|nr:MAG: hypothetical protein COA73_02300 [Candidatus Hydrogenedentota bacterium]